MSNIAQRVPRYHPVDPDGTHDSRYYPRAELDPSLTLLLPHVADLNNPHQVTKAQVGLSNVDNTSDILKPVSTAMQDALDLKSAIGHTHDDRYFTEAEVTDALANYATLVQLAGKSDVGHTHDDRYYTESEADILLDAKAPVSHNHSGAQITSGTISSARLSQLTIQSGVVDTTTASTMTAGSSTYLGGQSHSLIGGVSYLIVALGFVELEGVGSAAPGHIQITIGGDTDGVKADKVGKDVNAEAGVDGPKVLINTWTGTPTVTQGFYVDMYWKHTSGSANFKYSQIFSVAIPSKMVRF